MFFRGGFTVNNAVQEAFASKGTLRSKPVATKKDGNGRAVEIVQPPVQAVDVAGQSDAEVMLSNWQQTLLAMTVGAVTSDDDTMGIFFLSARALKDIDPKIKEIELAIETTLAFQTADGLAKLQNQLARMATARDSFSRKAAEISGRPDFVGLVTARTRMLKGLEPVMAKIFSADGQTPLLDPNTVSIEFTQNEICAPAVACGALEQSVSGTIIFGNRIYRKTVSKPVDSKIRDIYEALDVLSAGVSAASEIRVNARMHEIAEHLLTDEEIGAVQGSGSYASSLEDLLLGRGETIVLTHSGLTALVELDTDNPDGGLRIRKAVGVEACHELFMPVDKQDKVHSKKQIDVEFEVHDGGVFDFSVTKPYRIARWLGEALEEERREREIKARREQAANASREEVSRLLNPSGIDVRTYKEFKDATPGVVLGQVRQEDGFQFVFRLTSGGQKFTLQWVKGVERRDDFKWLSKFKEPGEVTVFQQKGSEMPNEYRQLRRALLGNTEFERDCVLFQVAQKLGARRLNKDNFSPFLGEDPPDGTVTFSLSSDRWRMGPSQQGRRDSDNTVSIGMIVSRTGRAWQVLYTVAGVTAAEFGGLVGKTHDQDDLPVKLRAALRGGWLAFTHDMNTLPIYLQPAKKEASPTQQETPAPQPTNDTPAVPEASSPEAAPTTVELVVA